MPSLHQVTLMQSLGVGEIMRCHREEVKDRPITCQVNKKPTYVSPLSVERKQRLIIARVLTHAVNAQKTKCHLPRISSQVGVVSLYIGWEKVIQTSKNATDYSMSAFTFQYAHLHIHVQLCR